MRKQLGILASLVLLLSTALLWTGCSDYRCYDPCAPVCDTPCQPACQSPCEPAYKPQWQQANSATNQPAYYGASEPECYSIGQTHEEPVCFAPRRSNCQPQCCPTPNQPQCQVCPTPCCEPLCKQPARCRHPNSNQLCCINGIKVYAASPKMCMLGDQYPLEFNIEACDSVCDVVVKAHLPEGVTYVRSEPAAKVEGHTLIWDIGSMKQGECIPAKVWVRCDCEGELCACFCATATPVRFCSLLCAKPILACTKCGPEEVCPGDPVQYTITVTNKGSCAAEDVVVTDNVPDGLEHSSCQKKLCFKLGTLQPCETKRINVCFTAVKRGDICNTVIVSACNADSVSCQWSTCVCCCDIQCTKTGPKEVQLGQNADYSITVTNTGDKPLTEVVVTDCAPSQTSIVSANGATINGNQAVWRLRELKAGEKVSFSMTLTTCTPGCFTNRVNVNNCQGCCASCEVSTRWRGRPALCVQVCDTEDPICIGESTSYMIEVVNQGTEPDSNVKVVVNFPPQVVPVSATGDSPGSVSGQTVTFAPVNNFGPRQTLRFRVDARAKESGDARVKVQVSSDSIPTPIVNEESTVIY